MTINYERDRRQRRLVKGDRLFIRVILRGTTIMEFMTETIADMTELIGEIRHAAVKYAGLARLQLRNHTRGWSTDRPLMLYPAARTNEIINTPTGDSLFMEEQQSPRMYFPWETH